MQLAPVIGMARTVAAMIRAFNEIGQRASDGPAGPAVLSGAIGEALVATVVGMLIALVGAILILIAVLRSGYRAEWLFWLLVVLGCLYLAAFPLGTIIGVTFLITALPRRSEFLVRGNAAD
jgi:hypothetical protein